MEPAGMSNPPCSGWRVTQLQRGRALVRSTGRLRPEDVRERKGRP